MGRKKKIDNRDSILIDTNEKQMEFSKFKVAVSWLTFLQNYRKELEIYCYDDIIKKSFSDRQWKFYKQWIDLIITNKNKSELTYDKLVNKLKREIKKSQHFLGLPENDFFLEVKIERGEINKETGLVSTNYRIFI